jgi:hypothetical protein
MRPVYNSAAKRARAAHQVDYQAHPVIDKKVEPRDIAVGVLRGSGSLNIGRAQQLDAIRVHKVNAWVLLVRVPEHNIKRAGEPEHPERGVSREEDHLLPAGQRDARHWRRPAVPDDAAVAGGQFQQAVPLLLNRSQHRSQPERQEHSQLHDCAYDAHHQEINC